MNGPADAGLDAFEQQQFGMDTRFLNRNRFPMQIIKAAAQVLLILELFPFHPYLPKVVRPFLTGIPIVIVFGLAAASDTRRMIASASASISIGR